MAKDPDKLMGSFARHSVAKTIPSFKRAKTPEDMEVLRSAFVEYIDFLNAADSFKMGTRTTLPEMFIGKLPTSEEKVHESQKPINTLEEIILQTTEAGETVLEQFAGSFIGADAIISIGKDGQGWRDYFGIELDTEIFNKAVDRLKEKYKDFRFTTVDDFYNESISETAIVGTMEKTTFEAFEKLALVRDKINSDLSGVLEVRYENDADLRRDGMFAKDFEHNIAIVNVKIESRTGTKNLKIVADPSSNTFVLFDIGLDKIVNRTRPEQTLDVVLMKMYDTFRRK